jgi:hypothetical protein
MRHETDGSVNHRKSFACLNLCSNSIIWQASMPPLVRLEPEFGQNCLFPQKIT